MTPFFSVIITVFNKQNYIKSTLESVLNQTFKKFEIIIVNDGSTDKSIRVINSITDKRINVISIKNSGASVSRNTGIKEAKGNYIALLDGDDLWKNTFLETIHKATKVFKEQMVFTTALAQKYNTKIVPANYCFKQNETYRLHNYFKSSLKFSILTSSSIVFSREIIKKTGLFDSTIVSGEDTDMWIRIGLKYKVLFINKTLVHYRYINESLSNTTFEASKKPDFKKYKSVEKTNYNLKKYLDIHRYSLAMMSKINDQKKAYHFYKSELNITNLPIRKRILLNLPKWMLNILLWLKSFKQEKLYYKPLKELKSS